MFQFWHRCREGRAEIFTRDRRDHERRGDVCTGDRARDSAFRDPQAVLDGEACCAEESGRCARDRQTGLRQVSIRLSGNLWLLSATAQEAGPPNPASWKSYLGEMRREFEYSIVGAPFPGEWNEATAMARFADGIILVLSAHRTRRIRARYMKNKLEAAQAHILGTVLSDRTFPIPEGIYRRL